MPHTILKMLEQLKAEKISVSTIEKDLGFSNGLLGKAAKGATKLSPEKEKKFHEYFSKKINKPKSFAEKVQVEAAINFQQNMEAFVYDTPQQKIINDEVGQTPNLTFFEPSSKLKARIAELEKENTELRKQVADLLPDATAWRTRINNTAKAIKDAPESILSVTEQDEITVVDLSADRPKTNYGINTRSKQMDEITKKRRGW